MFHLTPGDLQLGSRATSGDWAIGVLVLAGILLVVGVCTLLLPRWPAQVPAWVIKEHQERVRCKRRVMEARRRKRDAERKLERRRVEVKQRRKQAKQRMKAAQRRKRASPAPRGQNQGGQGQQQAAASQEPEIVTVDGEVYAFPAEPAAANATSEPVGYVNPTFQSDEALALQLAASDDVILPASPVSLAPADTIVFSDIQAADTTVKPLPARIPKVLMKPLLKSKTF